MIFGRRVVNPGALHSIPPRICRMTRLESPHTTKSLQPNLSNRLTHNNRSSYSTSFTVASVKYWEEAETMVHPASCHTILLHAPCFTRAEPSKLTLYRTSYGPTVGGTTVIYRRGCYFCAIDDKV